MYCYFCDLEHNLARRWLIYRVALRSCLGLVKIVVILVDRSQAIWFNKRRCVAQIAQSVEQRIENPCVPGSIPGLGTIKWCCDKTKFLYAQIAQSVEQRIENPCVPGSIPGLGTIDASRVLVFLYLKFCAPLCSTLNPSTGLGGRALVLKGAGACGLRVRGWCAGLSGPERSVPDCLDRR